MWALAVVLVVVIAACGGDTRIPSVGSYGARGDGVTDDTAAFLAAARAGPFRVPAGTYRVTDLVLPEGTTIHGAGDSSFIRGKVTVASRCTLVSLKVGAAGQSFTAAAKAQGVRCRDVTFIGGSTDSAVVSLMLPCKNLAFTHCTIATGGGWNGVSILDHNGTIRDVTFDHCHFMSQGRMGFECISRNLLNDRATGNAVYQRVSLLDCVFEPQGAEAVSFDGPPAVANCLIRGNVIKGAGIGRYPWDQGLEINGPRNMTVNHNTFYACRGDIWNLEMHSAVDCGWLFSDNEIDASKSFQSVPMNAHSDCVSMSGVHGGVFARNSITSAAPGGPVAWMRDCNDNDWRTTTWHDARGSAYSTPQQVDCTGNRF